jgi:hypothetical protein
MLDLTPLHALYQTVYPTDQESLAHPLVVLAQLRRRSSKRKHGTQQQGEIEWVVALGAQAGEGAAKDEWWEVRLSEKDVDELVHVSRGLVVTRWRGGGELTFDVTGQVERAAIATENFPPKIREAWLGGNLDVQGFEATPVEMRSGLEVRPL